MSLFSRVGRRGKASAAVVFAGSLFVYLGATAVPAMAATSCSSASNVVTINVGTDDNVVARVNAGNYELSINGNDWSACDSVQTDLKVLGSDAGNESFTFLWPSDFNNMVNIVDLGNGSDTLTLEDGGLAATISRAAIADPVNNDTNILGSANDGTLVGDMNGGGLADLRIDNAETIVMNGGEGDDTLDAGNATGPIGRYDGTVAANDIPHAGNPFTADTTLNGGNGDDFLYSGDGNDNFQGGPGADGVSYQTASNAVVVDLGAATGTGMGSDTLSDVQDATGSRYDDTLTGSSLDNELYGRGGDDTIDGAAGNDYVSGDGANDTLTGGTGDDIVHGWSGSDWMIAGGTGDGQDEYHGGYGLDTVDYSARTADNYLSNDGNFDSGEGTENDLISHWTETIIGGSGNDTLVTNSSGSQGNCAPTLIGGPGDDSLDGNGYCVVADYSGAPGPMTANLVDGTVTGDGSDTIANIHRFIGTDGNDTVFVDENNTLDNFWAGDGVDTVDGSLATDSISIDLAGLGNGHEVENGYGGAGDDEIFGNVLGNKLVGNDGVDYIVGDDGNDSVEGGAGNDSLSGGDGADTVIYTHAPAVGSKGTKGETIDNQLGYATGGDGQDSIGFFEIVKGSDFNDKIVAGQTFLDSNNRLYGRGGKDQLTGSNSSDFLNGGSGNDNIHSGGGDDRAKGGSGKDVLYGSNGDDVLSGGKGHDTGWGGSGNDACHSIEERHSC